MYNADMQQLLQKPEGVLMVTSTPTFNGGECSERLWVMVNYGKRDQEQAGHVLYQVDLVACQREDEPQTFRLRSKFRLSNLAACSQFKALESQVEDAVRVSDKYKHDRFLFVTFDDYELKIWRFDFQKGVLELLKRLAVECRDLSQIAVV